MNRLSLASSCLLLLAAGCSFPRYSATRTIDRSIPLAQGVRFLRCMTHNGDITIRGESGLAELKMHVTMKVRGHTQEEADRNLELMSVDHELQDGGLILSRNYDRSVLSGMSPCFSFDLEGPAEMALQLETHNGNIHAEGTVGEVRLGTHNGDVDVVARAQHLALESHNGNVGAIIDASGPLGGTIDTHNGDVALRIRGTADCTIEADTHNGGIRLDREATVVTRSKTELECRLGGGTGQLRLDTHNGNIVVR